MASLKESNVLILGLGESGLAMARWCAREGAARIVVADTREAPPHAAALASEVPAAVLHTGAFDVSLLDGVQRVLKSPGLSPLDAQVAPLLAVCAERGIAVQGELHLFAQALAALKAARGYAPKVLAITGTNGKTTTASMCAQLVERCGVRVALAGNIGPTMLDTLARALELEPMASGEVVDEREAAPPSRSSPFQKEGGVAPSPFEGEGWGESAAEQLAQPAIDEPDNPTDDTPLDLGGGPPAHLIPPPPKAPTFEHLPDVWVLELSSFQLDGITGFEPTAATVLNLSEDHLDWHGTMAAYAKAKGSIFGQHAVMVINRDDPQVEAMIPPPQVVKGTGKGTGKGARSHAVHREVVRFGLDAPTHPGDFGLVVENGMAWLVRAHESDAPPDRRKNAPRATDEDIHLQRLMPADALRVRGRHNAANALAALALATAAGLPMAPMLHGLRDYAGEPHRVEFVGSVGSTDAYDDSKGTNVGATVAALNGLGGEKAPSKLAVILGGDGKGQDFTPLADAVARHARVVALIGRDAPLIEGAIRHAGVPMQRHESLEAATRWCFESAHAGDAVLLSPACASFDMFRNYAHRAEVFVAAVKALAEERGEVIA